MSPSLKLRKSGFTLVEMLVSVAVMVLILTFIAQLMDSVTLSTGLSGRHVDADNQARTVFDRMSNDFADMPQRKDMDFLFEKPTATGMGADLSGKMFFYSEAPAFIGLSNSSLFPAPSGNGAAADPKSSLALIGYCINTGIANAGVNTPPPYCLQRLSKLMTWDGNFPASNGYGGIAFLTFPTGSNTPFLATTLAGNPATATAVGNAPNYSGTDPGFDVLSSEVFRMEFCFQVKDLSVPGRIGVAYSNYPIAQCGSAGTNKTTLQSGDPPAVGGSAGDRWYNTADNRAFICTNATSSSATWAPNGLADVNAIVVAIAILDSNTRKVITPAQIQSAAARLSDFAEPTAPSATATLMETNWEAAVNQASPSFASVAGIPTAAAGQIRIYQRYFFLNNH